MIDLKKAPYCLSEEALGWVESTLASMTTDEKIGQLICPIGYSKEPVELDKMLKRNIGGIMYRPEGTAAVVAAHSYLQEHSKIPMLIAADVEQGGVGATLDGTVIGRQMLAAATGDPEQARRLGYASAVEAASVGVNWAFSPVIDIDRNWRNPITNVRTYGSDPELVLRMGRAFINGAHEGGLAVSIKHFPGDGCDERDQHLHPTVNDISAEEWRRTYGKLYKTLIDEGAETVMVGHIAQPALVHEINPQASFDEQYRPATLSKELLQGVLREELGFNGMIVSDATIMVGFAQEMPRRLAVPTCIACGIDMFLFTRDFEEDYAFMMQGYQDGIITEERLNEAVRAILGFKAYLGLYKKQAEGTLIPGDDARRILRNETFVGWARELAYKGVTLVKDTRNYLPLTPEKYKRIALFVLNDLGLFATGDDSLENSIKEDLEKRGFEVYESPTGEHFGRDNMMSIGDFQGRYDLALYVFNIATSSSNTAVRINWKGFLGSGNNPWFVGEVPVVAVSLANPYHLIDIPRIHTYINAYTNSPETVQAVLDKLTGNSPFTGISPVDPFLGREDTKL